MPWFVLVFVCMLLPRAAWCAEAPAMQWLPGDPCVSAWPSAEFTVAERAKQGAEGGLRWIVVGRAVQGGALADPEAEPGMTGETPVPQAPGAGSVKVFKGLRFRGLAPIGADLLCLGVEAELPLPLGSVQQAIDWTNAQNGAAVLGNPGSKLELYANNLRGLAAFEGFSQGRWNPECLPNGAWDRLLAQGRRLFIVGDSSDGTRPVLGRGAVATYVLAGGDSEGEIVDAIRAGRAIVAERNKIHLTFSVNGSPPGSTVARVAGAVQVEIELSAREDVDEISIIGNTGAPGGQIVALHTIKPHAKLGAWKFSLPLDPGTRYLRAIGVIERGACRTMTNPVFIGAAADEAAVGGRERVFALAAAAVRNLDWQNEEGLRAALEKLLDDREVGPVLAQVLSRELAREQALRIRPLLESAQPTVRALAAFVLLRAEGETALPSLLPLLGDAAGEPRVFAARALAAFAKPEHLGLALKASRDNWMGVRQYGLAALARIPGPESMLRLRQALYDRADSVRHAVAMQLCRTLGIERARQEAFVKAFKAGTLEAKQVESWVGRAELRPAVVQAAAEKLPEAAAAKPPAGEPTVPAQAEKPAAGAEAFPTLRALRALARPRIDGVGDDEAWKGAPALGKFVLASGDAADRQTSVKAVYDEGALYLLFECEEPRPDLIVAKEDQLDGNVWLDDSMDIYICPSGSREAKDPLYYRFSVNTRGVRFDEERERRHWNAEWQAAAAVGGTSWTLEVAIPFKSLGAAAPMRGETTWLVDFVRHRRVAPYLDARTGRQVLPEESALVPGDARAPAQYATLKFGE